MENETPKKISLSLDIFPFLPMALGLNKLIRKDIDRLYKKHSLLCYTLAKTDKLWGSYLYQSGSLEMEEYERKTLGILLAWQDPDGEIVDADIISLLTKGWRYIITYTETHEKLDVGDIIHRYIKKIGGIDKINDDNLNMLVIIIIFISKLMDKEIIQNSEYAEALQGLININAFATDEKRRIALDDEARKELPGLRKLMKESLTGTPLDDGKQITNYELLFQATDNEISDTFAVYDYIFDFEGLSLTSVTGDEELTIKDYDEILYALHSANIKNTMINIDNYTSAMVVKYLAKAYKSAKKRYFINNRDSVLPELETCLKRAENTEKTLSAAVSELKSRLETLMKESEMQQKQIRRLENELQGSSEHEKELIALREYMFRQDRLTEQPETADETAAYIEKLDKIKGVVIGGHERWQTKMKELLPSFDFIHPDYRSTLDENLIRNANAVFIYVDYLSHSQYYKVMAALKSAEAPIFYLPGLRNEKQVITMIYKMTSNSPQNLKLTSK